MPLTCDNTPWELYDVDGCPVHVKREDLSSPEPGPGFSKIRGVARYLASVKEECGPVVIGVMDTQHSKAGWGVSYVCKELGLPCVDFYPVLKSDVGLRKNQLMCQSFGAALYPMKAGMSAVLYNQAKRILRERHGADSIMMPNGLKLVESIDATVEELTSYTPKHLTRGGTWVVSISSGTLGAAVYKGLMQLSYRGKLVLHLGYTRSHEQIYKDVQRLSNWLVGAQVQLVDENYEYKDKVANEWIPFPCNEYYDAKAFTWLARNVHDLKPPIVFWNIGA